MSARAIKKSAGVFALALILCLAACVNTVPGRDPSATPVPRAEASPAGSEEPTAVPEITPEPSASPETPAVSDEPDPTEAPPSGEDALGAAIAGPDHFKRYLTFENVIVYEEEGDTFVDAIAVNRYPEPITCAVDIVYYGADGEELARARLRMRDGSYFLTLAPGETYLLANIMTDMTLTSREFVLEFDKDTPVVPLTEAGEDDQ